MTIEEKYAHGTKFNRLVFSGAAGVLALCVSCGAADADRPGSALTGPTDSSQDEPPNDPVAQNPATDDSLATPGGDVPAEDPGLITDIANEEPTPSADDEMCVADVDIVFVMDVSTSMGGFIDTLADEILVVDQALGQIELTSKAQYGLVVFVDDVLLVEEGAPFDDAQALSEAFRSWAKHTSTNRQINESSEMPPSFPPMNSTFAENSLDALYAAATGFQWRPGEEMTRIVIHTTDDTFWNGPTTGDGIAIERSYTEVAEALQAKQIRTFSFTAGIGGRCGCDDVSAGWSAPFEGSPPLATATDGSNFDIDRVLAGEISLSQAITESVEESVCDSYTPVPVVK